MAIDSTDYKLIDRQAIDEFARRFRGELITPDHETYEVARKVWNASIDRYPALVARCTGVADVVEAVRFGREHDLVVAVRGGGHNVAGNATVDRGLVIDLSPMKGVRVDSKSRHVRAQAGLLWGELDRETQAFGLAVTGGLISSTGVAGFTLGGGIGWLQRRFGLAIDNLVSADLVLADGACVTASGDENPDLFWGIRGGGGNFGIVTSFEFDLHPVGPEVAAGLVFHQGDALKDVTAFYRDFMWSAPDDIQLALVMRLAPPAPFIPESLHGKPVVAIAGMHAGSVDEGMEGLRGIKEFGNPVADLVQPRHYVQFQSMLDGSWLPGFQNYWKADYMTGLPGDAIDVLARYLDTITSPLSDFKVVALGGAVSRVPEDATPYSYRDAPFILNINARWADATDSDRHVAWTRALWDDVRPFSAGGTYVNFMGDEGEERVRSAYGDAKYERLAALKKSWDRTNFFRLNQNIKPAP